MHADVIDVPGQGKIVETGSHAGLLDQKGVVLRDVAPAGWRTQDAGELRLMLGEEAGVRELGADRNFTDNSLTGKFAYDANGPVGLFPNYNFFGGSASRSSCSFASFLSLKV